MVQACQQSVQHCLERYDGHSCRCKGQVKHQHGGKEEEQEGEENSSEQELIQIIVARIDSVTEHVVLLPSKEVKQRDDDRELPMVDPSRGHVERVNVDGQDGEEIGKQGDGHAGASKARKTNKVNE